MAKKIFIALGSLLSVTLFWAAIETVDIYRYSADVPPINLDAKYKTGKYAPLENPAQLEWRPVS